MWFQTVRKQPCLSLVRTSCTFRACHVNHTASWRQRSVRHALHLLLLPIIHSCVRPVVSPVVSPVSCRVLLLLCFSRSAGVYLAQERSQEELHAAMRRSAALVNSSVSEGMSAAILEVRGEGSLNRAKSAIIFLSLQSSLSLFPLACPAHKIYHNVYF